MEIGVSQFAQEKGISRSRVLQLIRKGDIKAERVANQWVINSSQLGYKPNLSRPFNPKMGEAFLQILSSMEVLAKLDPAESARLRKRIIQLKNHDDPALLLRSWLRGRARIVELNANVNDLAKLRKSNELVLSGASNLESGMSDANFIEAYVQESQLKFLKKKFLLVESDKPNILFRVVKKPVKNPLPLGYVLADLADSYGPRERNKVKELIKNYERN